MSDIFREVDEDLRRERAQKIWENYGTYIIAAIVAVVVVVAAVNIWNAYSRGQAEDAAAAYQAADALAEADKTGEAADAFAMLADEAPGGYRLVAGMREAALMEEAGDTAGAVAAYDAVAAGSGDEALRELASLKAAMLLADTASPEELDLRLEPLSQAGKPWRFAALELRGYAALRRGDTKAAIAHFEAIETAEGVPPYAAERARDMLRGLRTQTPDGGTDAAPETVTEDAGAAEEAGE